LVLKGDGTTYSFDIAPFRKFCMLNGYDDIGLTLRHADKIKAFEAERILRMPWLDVKLP
jgi:3-isopropylmalate/(R)-2-methylmalate dehydratase small subunit